jgi:hypothetical protein
MHGETGCNVSERGLAEKRKTGGSHFSRATMAKFGQARVETHAVNEGSRNQRHWVVVDIQGKCFRAGATVKCGFRLHASVQDGMPRFGESRAFGRTWKAQTAFVFLQQFHRAFSGAGEFIPWRKTTPRMECQATFNKAPTQEIHPKSLRYNRLRQVLFLAVAAVVQPLRFENAHRAGQNCKFAFCFVQSSG